MNEHRDEMLDSLGAPPGLPPDPPAEFLRAVARRRRARRLKGLAVATGLTGAVTIVAVSLPLAPSRPAPSSAALAADSVVVLTRANSDPGIEALVLPEGGGRDVPGEPPLRMGLRWGPDDVDHWVTR